MTVSTNGYYVFQLTATDGLLTNSTTVTAIVNLPPVVNAGAAQTVGWPTNQVVLQGAVGDDGLPWGRVPATIWSLVSGPGTVRFDNAASTNATATFDTAGIYVLMLAASDGVSTNTSTVSVTVAQTPTVSAGPDLVLSLGTPLTLSGVASDTGTAGPLTIVWNEVSGPGTTTFDDATRTNATVSFSTNGLYILQLTASNGAGQSSSLVEVLVESASSQQDPLGLVAWWPANGTAVDVLSGQAGNWVNGAGYANDTLAQAFNFNSTNFLQVPAATNYDVGASSAGFTLAVWVQGAPGAACGVLGWSDGVNTGLNLTTDAAGTNLVMDIVDTDYQDHVLSIGSVFDGQWHCLAVTYDRVSGEADVYVDGEQWNGENVGSLAPLTSQDIYLGMVPGHLSFLGKMDELGLYRRSLTAGEIQSLYITGSVGD